MNKHSKQGNKKEAKSANHVTHITHLADGRGLTILRPGLPPWASSPTGLGQLTITGCAKLKASGVYGMLYRNAARPPVNARCGVGGGGFKDSVIIVLG
ncbi:hypothetical protein E2C01_001495 [Portunus trituberculatus]|uniref:Uncharacterized protein n=1 Tax=Portunus trituberculatus TaxID=210409 RepID=A0A5B7CI40_PORTR|nr:hypothetical protein [Portunus trituberculatus]